MALIYDHIVLMAADGIMKASPVLTAGSALACVIMLSNP
jgi:hypothetical protein